MMSIIGHASSVILAWNPSIDKTVIGYKLYYSTTKSLSNPTIVNVGNCVKAKISNLKHGRTYYFILTAYNSQGMESMPTNKIHTVIK